MPNDSQETLYAQELLDEQPRIVRRFNIAAGQNSLDEPDSIRPDQLATLQNADTIRGGLRKTRDGLTKAADDSDQGRVLGMNRFYVDGGTKFLTRVVDDEWQYWDGVAGSWTAISSVTLTAGLIANMVVAGGRQFVLNGTDNVFSTANGTAGTDEGNTNTDPPKTRFGIYHQNMLILSGNATNRSWVWPSVVLDPQTFDRSGRAIKVSEKNGDENTAMVNLSLTDAPGFIVFKNRSTYFVDTSQGGSDPSQWSILQIDPAHGCVGERAAVGIGSSFLSGDCLFLSKEGNNYRVRSLRRTINDKIGTGGVLSYAIEDILADVNHDVMARAEMIYFDNRVLLAIPTGESTFNNLVLALDLKNSDPDNDNWKWSIWTGWRPGAFALYDLESEEALMMGDGDDTSQVWRALEGSDDDGVAIEYVEESRREDFDLPELDKIFQFVEVTLLATDDTLVTVEAQIDGNGYTVLGTMSAASGAPQLPINLPFNLVAANKVRKVFQLDALGLGRDVQIRITHSDVGKTVSVLGYIFMAFLEPLHLETRT